MTLTVVYGIIFLISTMAFYFVNTSKAQDIQVNEENTNEKKESQENSELKTLGNIKENSEKQTATEIIEQVKKNAITLLPETEYEITKYIQNSVVEKTEENIEENTESQDIIQNIKCVPVSGGNVTIELMENPFMDKTTGYGFGGWTQVQEQLLKMPKI